MRDNNRMGKSKSFGGRGGSGSRFSDRLARPEMHKAICDECGNSCEVPFKPTSGKPVYCSDCFEDKMNEGGNDRRSSNDREFRKPRFEDREMFPAICDVCGKHCEVPFKPSSSKPILCSECFEEKGNNRDRGGNNNGADLKREIDEINSKLDRILIAIEAE